MVYIVLARKWRPRTFEEVVGQEHITKTLAGAIKQNRVSHAEHEKLKAELSGKEKALAQMSEEYLLRFLKAVFCFCQISFTGILTSKCALT